MPDEDEPPQQNGISAHSTHLRSYAYSYTPWLPETVDWRDRGYVMPVRAQVSCFIIRICHFEKF